MVSIQGNEQPVAVNEIELYQDFRSIGSSEGCWRTFDFAMYSRYPTVERLPCHLPNHQTCRYPEGGERNAVAEGAPATALTAWFDIIKRDKEARTPIAHANPILAWSAKYPDFPERYCFKDKKWKKRERGCGNGSAIGRCYVVHPAMGDNFYLRLLLHEVSADQLSLEGVALRSAHADAFTYEAFKYWNGDKAETYKAACTSRGLLQDDGEWRLALEDACTFKLPQGLRALFTYILGFNELQAPSALFDEFWTQMGDDFRNQFRTRGIVHSEDTVRVSVLLNIEERLQGFGKTLIDFGLNITSQERDLAQAAQCAVRRSSEPKDIRDELIPDDERNDMAEEAAVRLATLKTSQRAVYDAVLAAVAKSDGARIFIDAPGGTGKTYTFNTILKALRSQGQIVLAVASSGIAAILLELGRTFHSRFKAERLHPSPNQRLNISAQTNLAKLLRRCKAIIWDEAAMGNKYHLEALDLTLRDFMGSIDPRLTDVPFGGKTIILGGDFRQTLPIVKFSSRAQTVDMALTRSHLWSNFKSYKLRENMRIEKVRDALLHRTAAMETEMDAEAQLAELEEFAAWLLRLGNGTEPADDICTIALPPEQCLSEGCDIDALAEWVYPDLATNCASPSWLGERAILAPYNSEVTAINDKLSSKFPGNEIICNSADAVTNPSDVRFAPPELLNTFSPAGLPTHELCLKRNMPIMLLRNLSPSDGLCNGTRLLVKNVINGRMLEATIVTGSHAGNTVLIPRIKLSPDEDTIGFEWSRLQFPVRVAFAMTINKAQGQTLARVGVYLEQPCFSHGQLYVAASRVGHPAHIRFAVAPTEDGEYRTANIVYHEALT